MPYTRWLMTEADASALTGATLAEADLVAAEAELVDWLGWRPIAGHYSTLLDSDGFPVDPRVEAFGRAVAWQAAMRVGIPAANVAARTAKPDDGAVALEDERIAEWSATYATPHVTDDRIASRARDLLIRHGWAARGLAGYTR